MSGTRQQGAGRWIWFAPVALITLLGAVLAFRLGWIRAHLTETDVIEAYAARYLDRAGAGARASDCVAYPAQGQGLWLIVACTDPSGAGWRYGVNRFGGLKSVVEPGAEKTE
ncbi:hypothetical protein [Aestuariicoccus sp. MJ-SS9]|uniref:hypothetical protein n=1 Tax=Aestuariicoccus sp. MJ-SS9 TaxID=3079855 RepID=UPI00290EAC06|nr:hypothetical protein [Aestuariicoccus sp. MJ-SS9]MDU8910533.1 hypothetical protein [Aestuariicoccus sp. MJ-SS9]